MSIVLNLLILDFHVREQLHIITKEPWLLCQLCITTQTKKKKRCRENTESAHIWLSQLNDFIFKGKCKRATHLGHPWKISLSKSGSKRAEHFTYGLKVSAQLCSYVPLKRNVGFIGCSFFCQTARTSPTNLDIFLFVFKSCPKQWGLW